MHRLKTIGVAGATVALLLSASVAFAEETRVGIEQRTDAREEAKAKRAADQATLSPEGALYTCPMHPEVKQAGPGSCPICGMALESEKISSDDLNSSHKLKNMIKKFWIATFLSMPLLFLTMGSHLFSHNFTNSQISFLLQKAFIVTFGVTVLGQGKTIT